MKKVEITNIVTEHKYLGEIEDPTEWIASCIANNSWGKPERELPKKGMGYPGEEDYDVQLVELEFEKEVTLNLGDEATTQTWVKLRAEYDILITDITEEVELKKKLERKIAIGKNIQDLSDTLIHLITGDNMESERTAEEIAQMQTDFATINALISVGRLITAKPLIEAIDIEVNPQYEELKTDILALYQLNGF